MVPWTLARSRLARAIQTGEPSEVVTQLRSEYTAARLAHLIRSAVPELTAAQRTDLADLLVRAGGADVAA